MRIAWNRFGPWFWIPFLILLGSLVTWQAYRLLPQWIEETVEKELLSTGIVTTAFPVQQIGPAATLVGPSTFVYGQHVLEWHSLEARYRLADLFAGSVDHLHIEQPRIALQFLPPQAGLPDPPIVDEIVVPPQPQDIQVVPADPAEAVAPDRPGAQSASSTSSVGVASPQLLPGFREHLLSLPLNSFSASGGVIEISLHDETISHFSFSSRMERQPFGLSGDLVLEDDRAAAQISLRVPMSEPVVTFQGEAVMSRGAIANLAAESYRLYPQSKDWPQVVSSGHFVIDALLEMPQDSAPYGSFEASIDEITLQSLNPTALVRLGDLLIAGTILQERIQVQGGAEVSFPDSPVLAIDPFAARFSYNPETGLSTETEAFNWQVIGVKATSALRGLFQQVETGEWVSRMEMAFTDLQSPLCSIQPFSLLVESSGDFIDLVASEIGLIRTGTLWLEDFEAQWNQQQKEGKASLNIFGLTGGPMGSLRGTLAQPSQDVMKSSLSLLDRNGQSFLGAEVSQQGNSLQLEVDGVANLTWLNELSKWWGAGSFKIEGPAPAIEFKLAGEKPFLKGIGQIRLPGNLVRSGDLNLEGIRGDIAIEVRSLPRTRGRQLLTIERVSSGKFLMSEVSLKWEMPNFRTFTVHELTARIGPGHVSLEPFRLDPMDPEVSTQLVFRGLPGSELLRWLGEDRFSIEGSVSGRLALGWDGESLIIGRGILQMDDADDLGRFLFSDPTFIEERFASFGGVPKDLKQRFLDALLQEGIRIHSMSAELGPAGEPGHLLLKISLSGESKTEQLEVPIEGLVINNIISASDLGQLLGLFGPVRIETGP